MVSLHGKHPHRSEIATIQNVPGRDTGTQVADSPGLSHSIHLYVLLLTSL